MSKTRESGWYHVKIDGSWTIAVWTYHNEEWRIPFTDGYWYESAFEEIDERRIVREEQKTKLHEYLEAHFPTGFVGGDVKVKLNLDYTFTHQGISADGSVERADIIFKAGETLCVSEWTKFGPSIHRPGIGPPRVAHWGMIGEFMCIRKN